MKDAPVRFLSTANTLQAHEFSLERTGGASGIRDHNLMQSATLTPRQEFGGVYLHDGLAAKAAAYLYHLAANHPFVDGNKRSAALAALLFLDINGVEALPPPDDLERVTWAVADGSMSKAKLTDWFREQIGEAEASEQE